jgi:pyruvate/2-oxoglutarate dehydrogenase complex dihydrolipoamide acyltransferase (E2) component
MEMSTVHSASPPRRCVDRRRIRRCGCPCKQVLAVLIGVLLNVAPVNALIGVIKDAVSVGKTVSTKIDILVDTIVALEESIQDVKREIKDVRAEIKEVKLEIKEMKGHVSRLSFIGVIAGTFVLTKYGGTLLSPLQQAWTSQSGAAVGAATGAAATPPM